LSTTGPVIDWTGASNTQSTAIALSSAKTVTLADGGEVFQVAVSGALQIGPAKIAGDFNLALEQSAQGEKAWHLVASDVEVGVEAGGARVGISQGAGDLYFGKDVANSSYGADKRSGTLSGVASVTGVEGLTLSGTLAASRSASATG
jgi:hypothetical protein